MLRSWGTDFDTKTAQDLGYISNKSLEEMVLECKKGIMEELVRGNRALNILEKVRKVPAESLASAVYGLEEFIDTNAHSADNQHSTAWKA